MIAKIKNWYLKNLTNKYQFDILQKELLQRIAEEEPGAVPKIIHQNWISGLDCEKPTNEKSKVIARTSNALYGVVGYHSRYVHAAFKSGEVDGERYHFKSTELDSKKFLESIDSYILKCEKECKRHENPMKVIVS